MKRLGRWLFNFLAVIRRSLLLIVFVISALPLVVVCAGWVQSYLDASSYGYYGIKPPWVGYEFGYMSDRGELVVRWRENLRPGEFKVGEVYRDVRRGFRIADWKVAPSGSVHKNSYTVGNGRVIEDSSGPVWRVHGVAGVRYWALAIIALTPMVVPLLLFCVKSRRARRKQLTLCPHCGYDLRATPQRCPECGMVPTGIL